MKKTLLIALSFIFLTPNFIFADEKKKAEADALFKNRQYQDALDVYLQIPEAERKADVKYNIAECYRRTYNYMQAEAEYIDLVRLEEKPDEVYYHYGLVLMNNNKYDEAKEAFSAYAKLKPEDSRGVKFLQSITWVQDNDYNKSMYDVEPSKLVLNQRSFGLTYFDYGVIVPNLVMDGKDKGNDKLYALYFYPDAGLGNFDSAEMLKGDLGKASVIGSVTFNKDKTKMYFSKVNKSGKDGLSSKGIYVEKVYSADFTDGKWTNVTELPFNSNEFSCAHPSLSADEKELFFVSNMPSGFGGYDIYSCKWESDNWGMPDNLGKNVNTVEDEIFPHINADGSLYFSSVAHAGYGGFDIFKTEKANGKWGEPTNLGGGINSSKDDFAIVFDKTGKKGYISTNRRTGSKKDEIYTFTKRSRSNVLEGVLVDQVTNKPFENNVISLKLADKDGIIKSIENPQDGKFSFKIEDGKAYELLVNADGYKQKKITISKDTVINTLNIGLDKDPVNNEFFALDDIKYKPGTNEFLDESIDALERLYVYLKNNPDINAEIGVHTTILGSPADNLTLSQSRADNVKDYLTKKGISSDRTVAKGYGDTMPLADNSTPLGRKKNNRTELKVLSGGREDGGKKILNVAPDAGGVASFDNLKFNAGSSELDANAVASLNEMANYLKSNPDIVMEIGVHSFTEGTAEENLKMSRERARIIKEFLVAQGIDGDRLIEKGYGSTKKLVNDNSAIGKSKNSRTEFKVVDLGDGKAFSQQTKNRPPSKEEMIYGDMLKSFSGAQVEGLKFFVQVGAFRDISEVNFNFLEDEGDKIIPVNIGDNITRFVFEKSFTNVKEADSLLKKAINKGVYDAWLTTYFNGQRISMARAMEILQKGGN
jgi:outer membrane protein OmpA-like peptidoglycan-associated protein